MGYTHYWYRTRVLPSKKFAAVVKDFRKIMPMLEHLNVRLAGGSGEGMPEITDRVIAFNGMEKCSHESRDLGITWPGRGASGVASLYQTKRASNVDGSWFAGLTLNSRTCGGDCSHETFNLPQAIKPDNYHKQTGEISYIDANGEPKYTEKNRVGKYFDCCKTAYKPYDLAVNICLIIAKHYLGDKMVISSDGEMDQWRDAIEICQHFLGYGADFRLDD